MRILAKFVLWSFVFLTVAGVEAASAQASLPCVDLRNGFDFEVGRQDLAEAIGHVQTKLKKLEACLEEMQLNMSIYDPHLMVNQIDENLKTLNTVQLKLSATEKRLTKAEETIEMLDVRLSALEPRVRKPKAPVRKSSPAFIPDTPAGVSHSASRKVDAGKPITLTTKATAIKHPVPANCPIGRCGRRSSGRVEVDTPFSPLLITTVPL